MKSILITGGSGFIGKYLAAHFDQKGYKVWIYDKVEFIPIAKSLHKTEYIKGDILDSALLNWAISTADPEIIVHAACTPTVRSVSDNRKMGYESIITGTLNVLEQIRLLNPQIRLVYLSSSMVYGDFIQKKADELHPKNPKNMYGLYKNVTEQLLQGYIERENIDTVIIRPSAVYGPGSTNPKAVVHQFIDKAISSKEITVHGDGSILLDFTYVTDLVHGIYLAATNENAKGEAFNLTYGLSRSLNDLLGIIENNMGKLNVKYQAIPKNIPKRGTLDISKAQQILGFSPQINLETGINACISNFSTYTYA